MKKIILFFISFLLSSNLFAAQLGWDELLEGSSYQLNENIIFNQNLNVLENEWVTISEAGALSLPGVALYYVEALRWKCQDKNVEADFILVTPKNSSGQGNNEVGINYQKECVIGIYIEAKDLYSPSVFNGEAK